MELYNIESLRFFFPLRIILRRFIQVVVCINIYSFYWCVILWYRWSIVCFPIRPLKDICVVYSLRLLWIELLWLFVHRLLWEHKNFSCVISGSYGGHRFTFIRNIKLFSWVAVAFDRATRNAWVILFGFSAFLPALGVLLYFILTNLIGVECTFNPGGLNFSNTF